VTEAVLVNGDQGLAAEHLGRVLAVDGHLDFGHGDCARKLDLQVEARTGEDLRSVDRIDGLTDSGGCERAQRRDGANNRLHADGVVPTCPDMGLSPAA
jgi:hypothetical protein